ncbi:MAG: hypothetical protein QOH41_2421 [Blastocatellia bacterium]|jgi:hypothetical protein|nr:hypothetical protein [Blastocatellia bacterium]
MSRLLPTALIVFFCFGFLKLPTGSLAESIPPVQPRHAFEYLWYEAENMRGITETSRHEPLLNPSYLNLPASKAPGWSINGPGVSAEWTQGGESEWNSVAASADETRGVIWQDVEVPQPGEYKIWVRYADWANKTEPFVARITQQGREVARHEFGARDLIDPHDEVSMYWGWSFVWDGAPATLAKGPARISIELDKAAQAVRQVDCVLVTNDLAYVPQGRRKPDFAAMRYLREWASTRAPLSPLIETPARVDVPPSWARPKVAGRDFLMPWNIAKEFWQLYDKPPGERPLYPFSAEPIDEFVKAYSGKREVPIFDSKLVVPTVYINDLPELLKDGSAFRRYLAETKSPFAVLINYGSANFASDAEAQAAWKLLNGELRDQFLGWISGESVGFVWDEAPQYLKISPEMTRTQLLEAHRTFYTDALSRKWSKMFKTETGPMWDKMIPSQSSSSTSFAHALGEWGVRSFGMETAAVQPMTAMRLAFNRGAARQYGGSVFYYHAPGFGDTATTFTKQQNFAGPDNFFHSRYGATMGPSLSWYRKSYYLYYMSGASAIYLEQGFDQFFKPGPGEHPFQLNPLGRITEEFMRFAEKHPDPGTPYTPIAFLLDPAHGWEMTDYPQWPFEVSQINRSDRALRELFGAAYYPGLVREGEPASGERQAFVPAIFGNIFDVLVASPAQSSTSKIQSRANAGSADGPSALSAAGANRVSSPIDAIDSYRAVVVGGTINWTSAWVAKLGSYVRSGGTLVLNSAQIKGLPADLLGIRPTGTSAEADDAKCLSPNEPKQNLSGQTFRYDRVETKGADVLIAAPNGDPLVTVNKVGRGRVVFVALPDLLGEDERMTPFAAHVLAHLASEATPVHVEGDVEYMINRTARGWVLTLFNDNGVFKQQQGMAQVDRSASVNATISLRGAAISNASEWTSDRTLTVKKQAGASDSVTLNIAPGGIAVVELRGGN